MKLKKSQLKELIRHAIVEDIMNQLIKNPKTGNMIKVRTALQLPGEHPVNKRAKKMVAKADIDPEIDKKAMSAADAANAKMDAAEKAAKKKKKGFFSKLNPFSKKDDKKDDEPKEKPQFLGTDTVTGKKTKETNDRVGEFINDNEGNIPEEYVDKLRDLQKKAYELGADIDKAGKAYRHHGQKQRALDAEAQEMMDDIEQKGMDGEFDDMDNLNYPSGRPDEDPEYVRESKMRRFTVKEVRMWMKKLEENRYKKVYNSDARRVAWMVNN